MFDWGFTEFVLVAVVGLLVFGPERLPEVARNVGRWVGKVRRYIANVRSDFESELNTGELRELLGEQQQQIRELKGMVENAKDDFSSSMGEVTEELTQATDALNKTVNSQPLSALSDDELFADDDEDHESAKPRVASEKSESFVKPESTPDSKPNAHE
ncbi:MAG: Sec-independent protein translocase protein TatB [Granulosicoccaceae bacterium]